MIPLQGHQRGTGLFSVPVEAAQTRRQTGFLVPPFLTHPLPWANCIFLSLIPFRVLPHSQDVQSLSSQPLLAPGEPGSRRDSMTRGSCQSRQVLSFRGWGWAQDTVGTEVTSLCRCREGRVGRRGVGFCCSLSKAQDPLGSVASRSGGLASAFGTVGSGRGPGPRRRLWLSHHLQQAIYLER